MLRLPDLLPTFYSRLIPRGDFCAPNMKAAPVGMTCSSPSHASHALTHQPHFSENTPQQGFRSWDQLKQFHSLAIRLDDASNPALQSRIIGFCCCHDSGDMNYARHLFDTMPEPDIYIWNTMMRGYSRVGRPREAVSIYLDMLRRDSRPNNYTFPMLFRSFTRDVALECGKELHGHVVKFGLSSNKFVQNALIRMYSLGGRPETARAVFESSSKRDVVAWNAMISGYNRGRQFQESRKLFGEMEMARVSPTAITFVSVLSACSKLKDLETGRRVHQQIRCCKLEPNLSLDNALIDMYAACGEMELALRIFRNMKNKDVISWTAIVTGLADSGQIDLARQFFDEMVARDLVTWTAMMDGYIKTNRFKEALLLFRDMQQANVKPDEYTMVSVITACAQLGALELGEWINTFITKNKIKNDLFVRNALIDMYFKCGNAEKALKVFMEMPRRDRYTWTAMILGYANNGRGEDALEMFSQMLKASVSPDEITCVGVLCACTHAGMVEKGKKFFASMTTHHGVKPNVTHYGCMVDLLGRAGHLREAFEVIKNMPMKPNSIAWGSLLSACRLHKDANLAEMAAKKILELEPENEAVYVLLSNIYAACNRHEDRRKLRKIMSNRGITKIPGCSLIEMNGSVHEFVAGDSSHPQSTEIYLKLDEMSRRLGHAGYWPDTSEVFLDASEGEKRGALHRHSEKLAIAFGLISSGPGVTIRIVKNLRMCVDCHSVAKLVSQVYGREVVVRDKTRFHHFMHGLCSCKDYW